MTPAQRRHYRNGIWVCANHATLVDENPSPYRAGKLRRLKHAAERRAAEDLVRGTVRGRLDAALRGGLKWATPATNESRPGYEQLHHVTFTVAGSRKHRGRAYVEVRRATASTQSTKAVISEGSEVKHSWRDLQPLHQYVVPVITTLSGHSAFWLDRILDPKSETPELVPGTYITDDAFLSRTHRLALAAGKYHLRVRLVLGDTAHAREFWSRWKVFAVLA
jgi:hypothetical protein